MQNKRIWLCAALFLVVPAMSFAGGSTCAIATALIADGRSLELDYVGPSGPTGIVWYQFGATANHSYSVEVRDDLDPDNPDFTVSFYAPPVNCSSPVSNSNYRDTHLIEPAAGPHATRFSFTASMTGAYYVSVQNGGATGHYVTVTVAETTLYSNNYNSTACCTTYYGLQNTTSSSLTYVMTVYDINGNQIGSSGATQLNAGRTSYINSGSGFLATNNYGSVILTHDGPPAALLPYGDVLFSPDQGAHAYMVVAPFVAVRQLR